MNFVSCMTRSFQFLMTDVDTGEKLRFEFDSAPVWEGSARGYLRELPVVREFQPHQPGNFN